MKNMIENRLKAEIKEYIEGDNSVKNGYYSKKIKSDSEKLELIIQEIEKVNLSPKQ